MKDALGWAVLIMTACALFMLGCHYLRRFDRAQGRKKRREQAVYRKLHQQYSKGYPVLDESGEITRSAWGSLSRLKHRGVNWDGD